ncbi:AraC family transcriptional regulator [Paenibacillus sp. IB182496]|uniref:AraC family transcriptional regulator n=1 Tax=Paenibacillus sabuli TaxID=2772509 RepID=A0A927BV76_9BACL|nr:helix-turn-helix domain-containing protein [Paenibacillus sabuli]MBD2846516.1 AraC family transcriptional regulator [Paenibacillus sabuli]
MSAEQLKQVVFEAQSSNLISAGDQVDNLLERTNQSIIQFERSQEYQRWLHMDETEAHRSPPVDLIRQLQTMHASLTHVDNVMLVDTRLNKQYASNSTMNFGFGERYEEQLTRFAELGQRQALLGVSDETRFYTFYVQTLPLFRADPPKGYVVVHFNPNFFSEIVRNRQSQGNYMIVDQEHRIVRNSGLLDDAALQAHLPAELWSRIAAAPPEQAAALTHDGFYYLYMTPRQSQWSYVYAVEEQMLLQPIRQMRTATTAVTAILLLFSLGLYTASIQWSWKGWKRVARLLEHQDAKLPPHGDEFELMGQRISGILSQQMLLEEKMKHFLPEVKEAFLGNVLRRGVRSPQEHERVKQYNIPLDGRPYRVMVLEMDDYQAMLDLYDENDMHKFEYGVICVIRESCVEHDLACSALNIGGGRFAAVIECSGSAGQAPSLWHTLQAVSQFIKNYFPFTVTIGLSSSRSRPRHVNLSYVEAGDALRQKMIAGTGGILAYETTIAGVQAGTAPAWRELENELIQAVQAADREHAYDVLARIDTVALQGQGDQHYRGLQHQLIELALVLWRELSAGRPFPYEIDSLLQLSTLPQWTAWMRANCVDPLIDQLAHERRRQYEKICAWITQHLERRFEDDLRLSDVCRELGISVQLAKQALKDIQDTTFSEALFHIRMNKSKEWLQNGEIPLEEIATRLYYSNAQNFSRAFKKVVGMPPGQYRKAARS